MTRFVLPNLLVALMLTAQSARALDLAQCTRVTHVSHGGEADHVDLGEGRVMWRKWWSQEGTATNYMIEDCAKGQRLDVRTAEVNMHPTRTSFDKTDDALAIIALHESGARVFATLQRIAKDLDRVGRDITISTPRAQSCACAALYPTDQGSLIPYSLFD